MGWVDFMLCVGLRIDLDETDKSMDDLISILVELYKELDPDTIVKRDEAIELYLKMNNMTDRKDNGCKKIGMNILDGLCVSHLKVKLDGTETGPFEPNPTRFDPETYNEDNFGTLTSKDNSYILYFNNLSIDNSNGVYIDSNRAYSSGHIEFYNGIVKEPLEPSEIQVDILKEIAVRLGIGYALSWSLRGKGSSAATVVKWK
jgi:hypothetical protein